MNAGAWVAVIGGIIAILTAVGAFLHWVTAKVLRPLAQLAEDWRGDPERRGPSGLVVAAARPGVLERLTAIETGQRDQRDEVGQQIADMREEMGQQIGALARRIGAIEVELRGKPEHADING